MQLALNSDPHLMSLAAAQTGFPPTPVADRQKLGTILFEEIRWSQLCFLFGLHVILGLVMHRLPELATIHSTAAILTVFSISLYSRRPAMLVMCACYIAGSEVLWRMSKAFLFHETAKYVLVLICLIGIFRIKNPRFSGGILLYLALLLPSAAFTYYSFTFDGFRKSFLFNLSGPLALTAALLFCSNIAARMADLWKSVLMFSLPLAGVAAITLFSTYTRDSIRFTTDANIETSGGFGPNQVASSLALGALLLLMAALLSHLQLKAKMILTAVSALFAVQSVMTFSRGGVTAALLTLLVAAPFLSLTRKQKRVALGTILALALGMPVVFSRLNQFTGGKLEKRFSDSKMSGREALMQVDLELWAKNPVFGVGVGISKYSHFGYTTSHTEFTRAVAESGSLGALSYLTLGALCLWRLTQIVRDRGNPARPFLVCLLVWPWLYMAVNAGRTAAPFLALGMAFLTLTPGLLHERFESLPCRRGA